MDDETVGYLLALGGVIAAVVLVARGVAWLVSWLYQLMTHFVITTIVPHWLAIVICLAIAAFSPWLVRLLIYLLSPPVRRASIRWYWWKRDMAERRRFKRARRNLTEAYEQTRQSIRELREW
jgi:hypothetical protein